MRGLQNSACRSAVECKIIFNRLSLEPHSLANNSSIANSSSLADNSNSLVWRKLSQNSRRTKYPTKNP
jgi:hypothetical protein